MRAEEERYYYVIRLYKVIHKFNWFCQFLHQEWSKVETLKKKEKISLEAKIQAQSGVLGFINIVFPLPIFSIITSPHSSHL